MTESIEIAVFDHPTVVWRSISRKHENINSHCYNCYTNVTALQKLDTDELRNVTISVSVGEAASICVEASGVNASSKLGGRSAEGGGVHREHPLPTGEESGRVRIFCFVT